MGAAAVLERCEARGVTVRLKGDSLELEAAPGLLTGELKAELMREKAGVRAVLEAETRFMALWWQVCELTADDSTPEQRAEAERLIHGDLWEAQTRYLELLQLTG